MNTLRVSSIAAATALLVTLTACSADPVAPAETGDTVATATVRLAATTSLSWPQSVVADDFALWEEESLEVETTEFVTGRDTLQALLGGGADIAQVSPSPVTLAAYSGEEITILAATGQWSEWAVLASATSGIEDPEDLEGKRVGVTLGTSSEIAFRQFLLQNDVDAATIEFVNVSATDMASALGSGSVDAVNPWQPTAYQVQSQVEDAVALTYSYPNNYLLVATTSYVEKNREIVDRFLAVMTSADAVIASDVDAAAESVSSRTQLDVEAILAIWEGYTFTTAEAGDDVLREMQDVSAAVLASGTVTGDEPDFESLFMSW